MAWILEVDTKFFIMSSMDLISPWWVRWFPKKEEYRWNVQTPENKLMGQTTCLVGKTIFSTFYPTRYLTQTRLYHEDTRNVGTHPGVLRSGMDE